MVPYFLLSEKFRSPEGRPSFAPWILTKDVRVLANFLESVMESLYVKGMVLLYSEYISVNSQRLHTYLFCVGFIKLVLCIFSCNIKVRKDVVNQKVKVLTHDFPLCCYGQCFLNLLYQQ